MSLLSIDNLHFSYDGNRVIEGVSLEIPAGDFFTLLGPNGAGKTTLLRLVAGHLKPASGGIAIDGRPLSDFPQAELAKRIAVVPQKETVIFPFRVEEVVLMGRSPHLRGIGFENRRDREIARRAMTMTDVVHLAAKPMSELSGGEQHRVAIARALAQQTPILLLDEPNAHLDLRHQVDLFDLLRSLQREQKITLLCASHDVNLAAQYSEHMALLDGGRIAACGTPREVVTERNLDTVFQVPVTLEHIGAEGIPRISLRAGTGRRLDELPAVREVERPQRAQHGFAPPAHRPMLKKLLRIAAAGEAATAALLAFVRYDNQGLTLGDFAPGHSANLFSGALSVIMIAGILLHLRHAARLDLRFPKLLLTLSMAGIGILLWCVYPHPAIRAAAAAAFLGIKSYQAGFLFHRYFSRQLKPFGTILRSAAYGLLAAVGLLSAAMIYNWRVEDVFALRGEKYHPQAVLLLPDAGAADAGYEEQMLGVVERLTDSGATPDYFILPRRDEYHAEEMLKRLKALGVPGGKCGLIPLDESKRPRIAASADFIRGKKWKSVLLVADYRETRLYQELFTFHGIAAETAPIYRGDPAGKSILAKGSAGIRLLLFWIFGA